MEFKIGDRVEVTGNRCGIVFNKAKGKIVQKGSVCVGVEFERYIGGHSCDGIGRAGHCWEVRKDIVKLITNKKEKQTTWLDS